MESPFPLSSKNFIFSETQKKDAKGDFTMKSEAKLKMSYERQLELFEKNKQETDHNIEKSLEEVRIKMKSLSQQQEQLLQAKARNLQNSFRSYEEFLESARKQSSQNSEKKES